MRAFCRRHGSSCATSRSATPTGKASCTRARSNSKSGWVRCFAARYAPRELRLVAPQITLALDSSGAIDWPAPQPSFRADAFTVSRLTIEDGRLLLADAGSGSRVALQKLWFDGDIRSFYGPFHGEGAFVAGDELYGYRISGGRYDGDSGLKIKLGIDPSNRPLTGEIEGTIAIKQGVPEFEGTLALARPVGAALARGERVMSDPWQFNGKVHATPTAASLQELTLQYGPEERAINLTGKAEVALGAHPRLDGTVSARQVDVDRALADPDVTHRPPLLMVRSFFEAFVAAVKPPLPGTVGVTVDAMTVGGTTIQSLHGNVRFDDKGWSFNDVAFRAPGFTEVSLSGRLDNGAQGVSFTGPARLESADLKGLMGWLEGRSGSITGTGESLTARADITIASDRFTLERLVATHDQENVEGRLAYAWAAGNRPASLDGQLRAANLNIDAFTAFARAALSDAAVEAPRQVALVLDVGKATFAGVEARGINARLKFEFRHAAHRPAPDRRLWRRRARCQRTHRRTVVAAAWTPDARSRCQDAFRSDRYWRPCRSEGRRRLPAVRRSSRAGKSAWRSDRGSRADCRQHGEARAWRHGRRDAGHARRRGHRRSRARRRGAAAPVVALRR